jgi:hypothetical protein
MRKVIFFVLILLLMPVVLAEGEITTKNLATLHQRLKSGFIDNVPGVVVDGLIFEEKTFFEIGEKTDGTVILTYKGQVGDDEKIIGGDHGIKIFTEGDRKNPESAFILGKGSELRYKGGKLVKADIRVPVCKGDNQIGSLACNLEHGNRIKYKLGDYEYPVKDGSRIEYGVTGEGEDRKETVTITLPSEGKIKPPKKVGDGDSNPVVSYKLEGKEGYLDLYGNKISRFEDRFSFSVYYDTEFEGFYMDSGARIENFNFNHLRTDKVYLFEEDYIVEPGSDFDSSYLVLKKDTTMKMVAPKGKRGYAIEFVNYDKDMKAYGGIKWDKDKQGENVWYVHGSGKDPEGKEFTGYSSVIIDPVESKKRGKVFAKTKGPFSHINRNRFVHLNENRGQKGIREYYFTGKSKIDVGSGKFLERDFTDSDEASLVTQIDFKGSDGNDIVVEFEVKENGIPVKKKLTLTDAFIDDAGGVITTRSPEAQGLFETDNFFDMNKKARDEAIAQLNSNVQVSKILVDNGAQKKLIEAADARLKKIEAAKKAAAQQTEKEEGFPDFLKNANIPATIVEDLDKATNDPQEGAFIKSVAKGKSDTIAIIISSSSCRLCPDYITQARTGSLGGNVYEMKDDPFRLVRGGLAKKGIKIGDTVLSYPSTIFIDTKTGTVKDFRKGALGTSDLRSYFQ